VSVSHVTHFTHVCTVSSASGKNAVEKFNTTAEGKLTEVAEEIEADLAFSAAYLFHSMTPTANNA
jgi:hypothetical protein